MKTFTLLNRETFFPEIKESLKNAKNNVFIDAYIWIDDRIGNMIGKEILKAADRGVKIEIKKDLSASMFEHTPGRIPFFWEFNDSYYHSFLGIFTARFFNTLAFYIYGKKNRPQILEINSVAKKIIEHKNISFSNIPYFNHGKLIIIDNAVFIGGQCISCDYENWIDYNIKIIDKYFVNSIIKNRISKKPKNTTQHNTTQHNTTQLLYFLRK